MPDLSYEELSMLTMVGGIALFFAQSTAMMMLVAKRIPVGRWLRVALIFRSCGILLAAGGIVLYGAEDDAANGLADTLLTVGIINVLISAIQGIRVRLAIKKAIALRERELELEQE